MTDVTAQPLDQRLLHTTFDAAVEICREIGLSIRVAMRQGMPAMITADYQPTRLNVGVCKDGFVTSVLGRG